MSTEKIDRLKAQRSRRNPLLFAKKEPLKYAQPVAFRFVDALPLTPIGKVDYRVLEKEAE